MLDFTPILFTNVYFVLDLYFIALLKIITWHFYFIVSQVMKVNTNWVVVFFRSIYKIIFLFLFYSSIFDFCGIGLHSFCFRFNLGLLLFFYCFYFFYSFMPQYFLSRILLHYLFFLPSTELVSTSWPQSWVLKVNSRWLRSAFFCFFRTYFFKFHT
jgi:hypothetical protein